MVFNFKCCKCSEMFNVYAENLVNKDNLSCPNCSNQLPEELFQKLNSAAELLIEVDKNSTKRDGAITVGNSNHFTFKIQ